MASLHDDSTIKRNDVISMVLSTRSSSQVYNIVERWGGGCVQTRMQALDWLTMRFKVLQDHPLHMRRSDKRVPCNHRGDSFWAVLYRYQQTLTFCLSRREGGRKSLYVNWYVKSCTAMMQNPFTRLLTMSTCLSTCWNTPCEIVSTSVYIPGN